MHFYIWFAIWVVVFFSFNFMATCSGWSSSECDYSFHIRGTTQHRITFFPITNWYKLYRTVVQNRIPWHLTYIFLFHQSNWFFISCHDKKKYINKCFNFTRQHTQDWNRKVTGDVCFESDKNNVTYFTLSSSVWQICHICITIQFPN